MCNAVKERKAEEEKLQKKHTKELKEASRLYAKQQAQEAKAEQQCVAEVKKKEREAKAWECDKNWAQKQQEKQAATARKLVQQANRSIPTISQSVTPKSTKRHCALGDVDGNVPRPLPPQPPPKHTTRGRQIKGPKKLNSTSFSQAVNYYKTTISRDNDYCGWFYSLMFVYVIIRVVETHVDARFKKYIR
jgi:hypothetical protein